jgi:putative intracellular protease/amidase
MLAIAASEIANIPSDPVGAVQYAVLGTVLFEPVLTAIRRLAHQSLVKRGKPYTVVDRNLYTGQNPASAGPLAREVLKVLK